MSADSEPFQCVAATVLTDPPFPAGVLQAVCPACGQTVAVGGWPQRWLAHSPDGADSTALPRYDQLVRYMFGTDAA